MTKILDTNVLVRHVSGSPEDQAKSATKYLQTSEAGELLVTDVHISEFVWVLQSTMYQAERDTVRLALEAILALPAITVVDAGLLQDAIDLFAGRSMSWTDAYLVASARARKAEEVVSFDRFDSKLVGTGVRRLEPKRGAR
jgi:predicted nucleic-acid-binding protein